MLKHYVIMQMRLWWDKAVHGTIAPARAIGGTDVPAGAVGTGSVTVCISCCRIGNVPGPK